MQLLVLGMHRSGTSSVTRLLNMAGAWFGPEGISTGANEQNRKGFWERRDVRDMCDALLRGGGFDWWRVSRFDLDAIPEAVRENQLKAFRKIVLELDAHRPWVLKEPRLCLLLPLLQPVLEVPIFIHVFREPLEVAASVHARSDIPRPAALGLWELYTIRSLEASAGMPRLLVRYDELTADPVATTTRLLDELADLGVQGLRRPTEREITAFITPDLYHQRRSAEVRGLHLNQQQAQIAAAIDDGTVFDAPLPSAVSEGALESLVDFEETEDRLSRLNDAEERIATANATAATATATAATATAAADAAAATAAAAADAAAATAAAATAAAADGDRLHQKREQELRRELRQRLREERARRRKDVAEIATAARVALTRAERNIRSIGDSRAWWLTGQLIGLRRTLTPGMSRRQIGPLGRALAAIEHGKREVKKRSEDG
jgi:hypothetical protein